MRACPRCEGQMVPNYEESSCLQCGYVPRPDTELLEYLMVERNRKLWKNSHTKVKGGNLVNSLRLSNRLTHESCLATEFRDK